MVVWGLTGGIASGKSTVAKLLVAEGIPVLDADVAAREVVEPGQPALEEIREVFGPGVLLSDGHLNRDALGQHIFGDDAARARLNAIVHPRVRAHMADGLARLAEAGTPCAVMDIPLLYEARNPADFAGVAVVWVSAGTQLTRLMARSGLSEEQARARIASQMDLGEKARRADVVVDNNGSLEDTRAQVQWLAARMKAQGQDPA